MFTDVNRKKHFLGSIAHVPDVPQLSGAATAILRVLFQHQILTIYLQQKIASNQL